VGGYKVRVLPMHHPKIDNLIYICVRITLTVKKRHYAIPVFVICVILFSAGCNYVSQEEDYVNFNEALRMQDPALCDNLFRQKYKDDCYINVTATAKDPSLCKKIRISRDDCYINAARALQDPTICENIADRGEKRQNNFVGASTGRLDKPPSLLICYLEVAKAKKDVRVCDYIQHPSDRNGCYASVARETGDVNICEKLDPRFKDELAEYDPRYEQAKYAQERCYEWVAVKTKDATICERIRTSDSCYHLLARTTGDAHLCAKIDYQEKRDHCYGILGLMRQEADVCDNIIDQTKADQCYYNVVQYLQDAKICEKVISPDKKEACISLTVSR